MPEAIQNIAELLTSLPERISDVIKPWVESAPEHPALVEASGAWTYRQLADAVSGRAALARSTRECDRAIE